MFPEVDDGPSDPMKFRRTLLPLEIEDAKNPRPSADGSSIFFERKTEDRA